MEITRTTIRLSSDHEPLSLTEKMIWPKKEWHMLLKQKRETFKTCSGLVIDEPGLFAVHLDTYTCAYTWDPKDN